MTYGVRMFDSGGDLRLDVDETFTRLVHVERFAAGFAGTFSVPEFDDTKGLFYYTFFVKRLIDSIGLPTPYYSVNPHALPPLSWNNTTKVMTVSVHTLPPGWEGVLTNDPDYAIVFLHYR